MPLVRLNHVVLRVRHVLRQLQLLAYGVQHVAGDGHDERRHGDPPQDLEVVAAATRHVVRVHRLRQADVRCSVEAALVEVIALVAQVALHLIHRVLVVVAGVRRTASARWRCRRGTAAIRRAATELRPVAWVRPVGHHGHHASHGDALHRRLVHLVRPALPRRVGIDRLALALADADLPRLVAAGRGERHDGTCTQPLHRHPPLERLHAAHAAPDGGGHALDAELQQDLLLQSNHVANGHHREVHAPLLTRVRVDGGGPRRAVAAAQHVGAEDEVLLRVKRPAGAEERCPPGLHVGVACQRVADDKHVVRLFIEFAPRVVARLRVLKDPAALQLEVLNDSSLALAVHIRILIGQALGGVPRSRLSAWGADRLEVGGHRADRQRQRRYRPPKRHRLVPGTAEGRAPARSICCGPS
mmetsp:Transcript_6957/g.17795  ORF Transcript_6957/g.17795 Transcript_6957/m.17795 type:complete len:414 (+) Transcript_6957:373-1614(+)